jgi:biopolymer transport protein ExbD
MAGASIGENEENPVAINVVAMVDVIFCLCVFFMCSMKWAPDEGRLEAWLPKDSGRAWKALPPDEIRVVILWDGAAERAIRQFGSTVVGDDEHLKALIADAYDDCVRLGYPRTPCIVDAGELVPWKEVVNVINLAKAAKVDKIEFTAGRDYEAPEALPARK